MMIKYDDSYKLNQGPSFAASETLINEDLPKTHTLAHYHSDVEIIFIEDGNTNMFVAGCEFKAGKGNLIIVNPYEVHTGETLGGKYSHKCICFDMQQIGLKLSDEVGYQNLITDAEFIKPYFSLCYDAIKNRSVGWEMLAKGSLLVIFSFLNDKLTFLSQSKEQEFSRAVLQFIYEHYSESITSKDGADEMMYEHSYFCRKFKRVFLKKFSDFLNEYRVLKAIEMLKNKSVSETAIACGFQNIGYFSRVFKFVTGQSPSQIKNK